MSRHIRRTLIPHKVVLHVGDCRDVLATLPDNSVDSVVCDPPYELGFMGKKWDNTGIAIDVSMWAEVLRVLKPGGHLLAFGGTRTYHRMACAIEDAGFEIRDMAGWLYGAGFPKSLNVSKAIDKSTGKLAHQSVGFNVAGKFSGLGTIRRSELRSDNPNYTPYVPSSEESAQWQGWGTALKPAQEPICVARKKLSEKNVVANVLKWGTGAINIDGCRVETFDDICNHSRSVGAALSKGKFGDSCAQKTHRTAGQFLGRWPANIMHDGSPEVVAMFPDSDGAQGVVRGSETSETGQNGIYGRFARVASVQVRGDSGSAARFFYSAKANKHDRVDSIHPTVKPVKLIRYLVRLVTPPGGIVLDPFAGTTGEAAFLEGFKARLIEKEIPHARDIIRRMKTIPNRYRQNRVQKTTRYEITVVKKTLFDTPRKPKRR